MGRHSSVKLDTNSLPSDEARQLRDLINSSNFFDLPSKSLPAPKGAADYSQYKITIQIGEERTHTIETNDIAFSKDPNLAKLVDFLEGKASNK